VVQQQQKLVRATQAAAAAAAAPKMGRLGTQNFKMLGQATFARIPSVPRTGSFGSLQVQDIEPYCICKEHHQPQKWVVWELTS
jgi:hypothetical protein